MCWSAPCMAATAIRVWMYVWITVSRLRQKHLIKAMNLNEMPCSYEACHREWRELSKGSECARTVCSSVRTRADNCLQVHITENRMREEKQSFYLFFHPIQHSSAASETMLANPVSVPATFQATKHVCPCPHTHTFATHALVFFSPQKGESRLSDWYTAQLEYGSQ